MYLIVVVVDVWLYIVRVVPVCNFLFSSPFSDFGCKVRNKYTSIIHGKIQLP